MTERTRHSLTKYQRKLHRFYETKKIDACYEADRADYWVGVARGYRSDWRGMLNIARRAQRGIPITIPQQYKDMGFF